MNQTKRVFSWRLFSLCAIVLSPLPVLAIEDDIFELDPFVVPGENDRIYDPQFSNSATLVAIERDRIPFITAVITESLMNDMGINNLADISLLIPGMSMDTNPAIADEQGQPALQFRVRGFQSRPLYNGFQTGGRIGSAANIARVEVSKGPNSVLYGQSSGGGIVNLIPRSPQFDEAHLSLEAGLGNRSFYTASFDAGGPLQGDNLGQMAFRVGGSWTEFQREQIFFQNKTGALNSAFTWIPVPRLKFDVVAEYVNMDMVPSRTAAFVSVGSGPDRVSDPFNRQRNDRNFNYTGPFTNNIFETAVVSGYATATLMDGLTLRLGGIWNRQTEDSMRFVGAYGLGTAVTASSPFEKRDVTDTLHGYKVDLLYRAQLGGFSIDSILGYESYRQSDATQAIRTGNATGAQVSLPVTIPFDRSTVVSDWPAPPPLSSFTHRRTDDRRRTENTNLRFSQIITSPDERWTAILGIARGEGEARITNLISDLSNSLEGSATTYNVGVSYRVIDNQQTRLTLFGNYSTSFLLQEGNQQNPADFMGFATVDELRAFVNSLAPRPIAPEKGDGFELGGRVTLMEGQLTVSAAYFDQSRTNIRRSFFVRASNVAGITDETVLATYFLASGEENIRGVDFDVTWRPMPGLNFIGGATFANGKVKSNINEPGEEGLSLPLTPETMLTGWVRYDFADGPVAGLSLGLGANYTGSARMLPAFNDRFRISDSYTDVMAMVRYTFNLGNQEHEATVHVRNLFDSQWTNEANWLSEGRQIRLTYLVRW